MRNMRFAALVALVVLLAAAPAHAAKTAHYDIEALGMGIDIPAGLTVLTRETPADDPTFKRFGLDGAKMIEQFETNSIYFNAFPQDAHYEILVAMKTSDLLSLALDFNLYSDAELLAMTPIWSKVAESNGQKIQNFEIHQHPQTKFVKMQTSGKIENVSVNALLYYTVLNEKAITITINAINRKLSANLEELITQVVDSARFADADAGEPGASPQPIAEPPYRSDEAGVSFAVPEGWVRTGLDDERSSAAVKYLDMSGNELLFGLSDVYAEMTEQGIKGLDRPDVDNSAFSFDALKQMYESEDASVVSVEFDTVNGIQYFMVISNVMRTVDGESKAMTMRSHVVFSDGMRYEFSCVGDESAAELSGDYQSMLSSVQFDTPPSAAAPTAAPDDASAEALAPPETAPLPTAAPAADGRPGSLRIDGLIAGVKRAAGLPESASAATLIGTVLVSLFFSFMLCTLPIIVYRFVVRGRPLPRRKAIAVSAIYGGCVFAAAALVSTSTADLSPSVGALVFGCANYFVLAEKRDRSSQL